MSGIPVGIIGLAVELVVAVASGEGRGRSEEVSGEEKQEGECFGGPEVHGERVKKSCVGGKDGVSLLKVVREVAFLTFSCAGLRVKNSLKGIRWFKDRTGCGWVVC